MKFSDLDGAVFDLRLEGVMDFLCRVGVVVVDAIPIDLSEEDLFLDKDEVCTVPGVVFAC